MDSSGSRQYIREVLTIMQFANLDKPLELEMQ